MYRNLLPIFIWLLIVSTAGAVDFGWDALPEGGIEYRVQVEPGLVDSFRQQGFTSDVPPGLRDIRRIRIEVGNTALPNQGDVLGPKTAQTKPPAQPEQEILDLPDPPSMAAEQKSSPDKTFDHAEPTPAVAQTNPPENASATSAAPPLLDSSRPVPALPFFQHGPAKEITADPSNSKPQEKTASVKSSAPGAIPAGGLAETTSKTDAPGKPGLAADEGGTMPAGSDESSWRSVQAAMQPTPGVASNSNGSGSVPVSKPWGLLMLALLGLFASLGANVYLAWIHQGVRAKYQALVAQVHGGTI